MVKAIVASKNCITVVTRSKYREWFVAFGVGLLILDSIWKYQNHSVVLRLESTSPIINGDVGTNSNKNNMNMNQQQQQRQRQKNTKSGNGNTSLPFWQLVVKLYWKGTLVLDWILC